MFPPPYQGGGDDIDRDLSSSRGASMRQSDKRLRPARERERETEMEMEI